MNSPSVLFSSHSHDVSKLHYLCIWQSFTSKFWIIIHKRKNQVFSTFHKIWELLREKMRFSSGKKHHMDFHPWDLKVSFDCFLSFLSLKTRFRSILDISDNILDNKENRDFQEILQNCDPGTAPSEPLSGSTGFFLLIFVFYMHFSLFYSLTIFLQNGIPTS